VIDPNEHKNNFLIEMGFTSLEIARVQAIKNRKRNKQGTRNDICVVPKLFSDYNSVHKLCYAQVFGDAAAEAIFGIGPWLTRIRNERVRGPRKRKFCKGSLEKREIHIEGKGLDSKSLQENRDRRTDSCPVQPQGDSRLHSSHTTKGV
jgi:hypothetical protein